MEKMRGAAATGVVEAGAKRTGLLLHVVTTTPW